jgi:hypothetical protein
MSTKRILIIGVVVIALAFACGSGFAIISAVNNNTTSTTTETTAIPTNTPNNPTSSATPTHVFSSIQDAAQGESHGKATSKVNGSLVLVTDDLTGYQDPVQNDTQGLFSLDEIVKTDCFNIQQALWYLKSAINQDGSTKVIKSSFSEVDITFVSTGKKIAYCKLTSNTVDVIDRAGMWTDGDIDGAWSKYDSAIFF